MAQCHGEIVCKSGASDVTESMGKDDTALVKAYEKAVKTFAESAKAAEGERAVMDGESESDIQSERSDEGRITAQWQVGSRCRTVWSEDGLMYPAMILSVTGQRCRVEFEDYGNEEEVDIGALLPPDSQELPDSLTHVGTLQAGQGTGTEWQVGSRCRAVWSEDGLIYPAVILSVTGHHCQVEFEGYGNKEELELSALLPLETCKQGHEKCPSSESPECMKASKKDKKKPQRGEERKAGGHARRPHPVSFNLPPPLFSRITGAHEDEGNRSNPEPVNIKDKKMTSRREGQEDSCSGKSRSPPFTFFPPMPPGYDCSGAFLHLPPPPPPPAFLSSCGRSDSPAEDEDLGGLSSMLLSWYLCGYHTGCYMALQQARKSQEQSPERAQAKSKPKKHSY
ncbi:survival motor neuron protein 1 isoform X3 [Amia ocellicauda]|uniref:survival motor neuron protein 1 isoform X3 n=1 Tax=Amia ocellicauda TaxID=2972642 RepID=UPI0034638FC3|nr:SMN protein [Amia calva]